MTIDELSTAIGYDEKARLCELELAENRLAYNEGTPITGIYRDLTHNRIVLVTESEL